MKLFASRYLLFAALSLSLAACQSRPTDEAVQPDPWQQVQQSIASSELDTAEDQLTALQAQSPDGPRLEQFQRQLAEAYLQRSQMVLQKGDVNAAATALSRARVLMPKAPALIGGVNGAIAQARKAELEKIEAAVREAEARPPAQVLDPTASMSNVTLEMASGRRLRSQLDNIATDVVNYRCDVIIQVARPGDYRRLEALLRQRVGKLSSGQPLQVGRRVEPGQPAQMVLIPHLP